MSWTVLVVFVAVVLPFAPRRWRIGLLAGVSLAYYGWGRPVDLVLMGLTAAVVFAIGRAVRRAAVAGEQARSRRMFVAGVAVTLAVLGVFKYAGMAITTVNGALSSLFGMQPLPLPTLLAPLGISFITFGFIHFLAEMRRDEAPEPGPVEFALAVFLFPTVSSGPIKDFGQFMRDAREHRRPGLDEVAWGVGRIIVGLGKKFVLADALTPVTVLLIEPDQRAGWALALGMYAYTFRIYLDFSGYSDMAIGAARLLGFRIAENFDWPYLRSNIAEFWGHWHMTLTRFITTYVFIPLGGSRVGRWRTARNTLIAMALSGLWHGAAWNFVAWGLWHGVGLVLHRWFKEWVGWRKRRSERFARLWDRPVPRWLARASSVVLTFNFVAFGWVLFVLPAEEAWSVYVRIILWHLNWAVDYVGRLIPGTILPF